MLGLEVHFNYWIAIIIMMIGLYGVIAKRNLIKQAISLGLFSTGLFLFYISMSVISDDAGRMGTAPVWEGGKEAYINGALYDNPLPHVLMLTAIVVSVSILAVALAIIVNIKRAYGTVEEDEILDIEAEMARVESEDAE
ncbi:MAG: cation:proton antiporter subunit C [Planctomycetes bacterium]|nr:cation:proton antiporter subunit C [Planctomycetota bacterium]